MQEITHFYTQINTHWKSTNFVRHHENSYFLISSRECRKLHFSMQQRGNTTRHSSKKHGSAGNYINSKLATQLNRNSDGNILENMNMQEITNYSHPHNHSSNLTTTNRCHQKHRWKWIQHHCVKTSNKQQAYKKNIRQHIHQRLLANMMKQTKGHYTQSNKIIATLAT